MHDSKLIYAIYLPTFLLAFCRGLLVPVLPLYASSFDVSYGWVGLVLAAEGLGMLAGDLPSGVLLERIGRKRSMLIGIAAMGAGTLAFSWAGGVQEMVLYGFVVGLGGSLWNLARHAYLADAPLAGRGKVIALFGGINRIGRFAGPFIGGAMGAALGLRTPFLLYAMVAAVAFLFPLRFVDRRAARPPVQHTLRQHVAHLGHVAHTHWRALTTAGSGQLFAQAIRSGRDIIVPLYAADVLGLDVGQVGLIVGVAAAVDMSLFYPAGYIMDRFGRKFAYVPSFTVQALGMALIPFTGGFTSLLLATSVIGLGNGLGSGTMMTLGADLAPTDARGEFLGVWRLIGDAGSTSGPVFVGGVADLIGLSLSTFLIAGVGLMAAATLGLLVPETLHRKPLPDQPPEAAPG